MGDPGTAPSSFAEALTAAVDAGRYSLSALHRRLRDAGSPVSVSTLSYWRSGSRHPEGAQSRVAVAELERILKLPTGALTQHIGSPRRPGQVSEPGPVFSDEYEQALDELHGVLDVDPPEHLREISSSTVATAGADGRLTRFLCRSHVQATTKRVRAIAVMVPTEPRSDGHPRIFAMRGGRITGEQRHPSGTLLGARFELDRPLDAPERSLIEFGVELPESYEPQFAVAHGAARRTVEMLITVEFEENRVPDWVAEFEEDGDTERDLPRRPPGGRTAIAVRHGFGPGYFGISWGFDR